MGDQCLQGAATCPVGAASQLGRCGLGWSGLHFSPPEGGLWGLQDKEGVARSTSSPLFLDLNPRSSGGRQVRLLAVLVWTVTQGSGELCQGREAARGRWLSSKAQDL